MQPELGYGTSWQLWRYLPQLVLLESNVKTLVDPMASWPKLLTQQEKSFQSLTIHGSAQIKLKTAGQRVASLRALAGNLLSITPVRVLTTVTPVHGREWLPTRRSSGPALEMERFTAVKICQVIIIIDFKYSYENAAPVSVRQLYIICVGVSLLPIAIVYCHLQRDLRKQDYRFRI